MSVVLTPNLSESQLKENIDALVKQGVGKDQIQAYVNNYKKSGTGYTLNKLTPTETTQPGTLIGKTVQIAGAIGNALTQSEQGLGRETASAIGAPAAQASATALNSSNTDFLKNAIKVRNELKSQGKDTTKSDALIKSMLNQAPAQVQDVLPNVNDTAGQVAGNALGTALDIASFGSYGKTKTASTLVNKTLGTTLKDIGTKTLARTVVGAGTGYGYDVANNLQQGKTGLNAAAPGYGTLIGGAVPAAIGAFQAGKALTKATAPQFINSLIKPSKASFSYGKDPGRTVAELGVTGNSLSDFEKNLTQTRSDVGSMIGAVYEDPRVSNLKIDVTDEVGKIDTAIAEAAKGGKNNQGIVTTLQNIKDALLNDFTVNADGTIVPVSNAQKDLSALSPKQAFDLKDLVSSQTKFTGSPSDDKTVNAVLKSIYGGIKDKLNTTVSPFSPEITDLNQKYADLTSAVLATANRDAIAKRSGLISFPVQAGGAAGIITAIATGGAAIPAILAGASVAALDKALESTAVRTRIAAWLGKQTPGIIQGILQKNPAIATIILRLVPKVASQLGQRQ